MAESYPETNVVSPMDDADEEGGEQVAFKRGASVVDRYYSHYFKTGMACCIRHYPGHQFYCLLDTSTSLELVSDLQFPPIYLN